MKILRFGPSALAVGVLLALSSMAPAQAAPDQSMPLPGGANVEQVQLNASAGHWHGYRGTRTERPGTRRYSDGYWYPLAAFGVESGTTGSIGTRPVRPMQRQTYCQGTFGGTNGDGSMPCDNGF